MYINCFMHFKIFHQRKLLMNVKVLNILKFHPMTVVQSIITRKLCILNCGEFSIRIYGLLNVRITHDTNNSINSGNNTFT